MSKLQILTELEGFDDPMEMMQSYICDSLGPAICMNEDCDCTYEYEHDSTDGWCDSCETNSVVSCFILGGVI